jgi:hypothetical protein
LMFELSAACTDPKNGREDRSFHRDAVENVHAPSR